MGGRSDKNCRSGRGVAPKKEKSLPKDMNAGTGAVVSADYYRFPDHPFLLTLAPNPGSQLTDLSTMDELYGSDEFRMYSFKIKRCTLTRSHDWTQCPFAHRGEKARRRDPRRFGYVAIACPEFRNGDCSKGEACEFAHGVFEYWLHPARYRTRACNAGPYCQRKVCFFAHTPDQLRAETKYQYNLMYPMIPVGGAEENRADDSEGGEDDGAVYLGRATSAPELVGSGCDLDEVRVGAEMLRSLRRLKIGPSEHEADKSAGSEISDLDLPHVGWIVELVD